MSQAERLYPTYSYDVVDGVLTNKRYVGHFPHIPTPTEPPKIIRIRVPTLAKWGVCDPKNAPYVAGVYAIIVDCESFGANKVAYIGESICLANRLRSHSVIRKLRKDGYAPIVRFFASKYHFEIEPRIIRKHKPVFNILHK